MQSKFITARLLTGLFIWSILLSILLILISMQNGRQVSLGTQTFDGPRPVVKNQISDEPDSGTTSATTCPSGFVMLYEGGLQTGCSLVAK